MTSVYGTVAVAVVALLLVGAATAKKSYPYDYADDYSSGSSSRESRQGPFNAAIVYFIKGSNSTEKLQNSLKFIQLRNTIVKKYLKKFPGKTTTTGYYLNQNPKGEEFPVNGTSYGDVGAYFQHVNVAEYRKFAKFLTRPGNNEDDFAESNELVIRVSRAYNFRPMMSAGRPYVYKSTSGYRRHDA